MSVPKEQWDEWAAQLESSDMGDVLNAMLVISECGDFVDAADTARAARLLDKAGANIHPLARQTTISMPAGPLTFEEFREQCLARVKGDALPATKTKSTLELKLRLERYTAVAAAVPEATGSDIDEGKRLLRALYEARQANITTPLTTIYEQVTNAPSVTRAEATDRTGYFGGPFMYCLDLIDDPECRALLSLVQSGIRVELSERLYDMQRIRAFWIRAVCAQQFAFRRMELLDQLTCLPDEGWAVGRP